MGNRKSKYSECYSDNPASVINLSDNVVKRIAEGEESDESNEENPQCVNEEKLWMDRLKCIDHLHSKAYNLSFEGFQAEHKRLLAKFTRIQYDRRCDKDQIITCLRRNGGCALNCRNEIKKFEECIDAQRLLLLKRRLDEDEKTKTQRGHVK